MSHVSSVAGPDDASRPGWVDGLASDRVLRAALARAPKELRLRVVRPNTKAVPPYAPLPDAPQDARFTLGSSRFALESIGDVEALGITTSTDTLHWGEEGSSFERYLGRVWLDARWPLIPKRDPVEPDAPRELRLLVAELLGDERAEIEARANELAGALASYLELAATAGDSSPDADRTSSDEPDDAVDERSPEGAHRYTLRFEGEHLVLRDLESAGPRRGAALFVMLSLVLGALAVYTLLELSKAWSGEATSGSLLGLGALSAILVLASYAMASVARFSYAYVATSTPLAWFADDRIVVAPWVSRDGAIDTQPEGRYGAAIKIAEVERVVVEPRGDEHALKLETAHGPIDVLSSTRELCEHWARAIERVLPRVAAPRKKATALMRARARREGAAPGDATA
jgi:hypothetical protein